MALINVAKRETLLPDGRTALVHRVIKIFGVPIFEDSFVSNNENIVSCFLLEEEEPSGLYDTTKIGFKPTVDESDKLG